MTWSPLALSIWVASWACFLALIVGTAIAWVLVKTRIRFKWLLEGLTMLGLVLPPTVMGYYVLTFLGRQGLGPLIEKAFGFSIVFSWAGAVVASTIAALPLVMQLVRNSLENVSQDCEDAARVDGCSNWQLFWQINLRIAWRGVVAGALLGFLRAMGEFGITLMVAGNIPGRTQTISMALYDAVQANALTSANQMVILLTMVTFAGLFVALRLSEGVARTA
jgi:molybdate transport system permease protein